MLKRYVGTVSMMTCHLPAKLEGMLGSFGQQTRVAEMQGMKETKLTDFFARRWLQFGSGWLS